MRPERPYRCSRATAAFFKQIWSPQETIIEVGGLDEVLPLDPVLDNKSIFHSDVLFGKLEKYYAPFSFSPVHDSYQYAHAMTKQAFRLPRLVCPVVLKAEVQTLLKHDKNSGSPMFVKKADAYDEDWELSKEIVAGRSPPPCVAFHRSQHGPSGPKTRLVWGYPQSMTILEAKYAAPLIRSVATYLTDTVPYHSRKIGLSANLTKFENRPFKYGFDYSGYDASVPRDLIDMAFDILKSNMAQVDEEEWEAITRYFKWTTIVMPDMNVYRKQRGIPSGSYFTQLVGSVVNYFAQMYAFHRAGSYLDPRLLMVLGDDSLVAPSKWVPVNKIASLLTELNLTVNTEKSTVMRDEDALEFLGHFWPLGLPEREAAELLKRIRFPERWSSLKQKPEERFAAFLCDGVSCWSLWNKWRSKPTHIDEIMQAMPRVRIGVDVTQETGLSKFLGPTAKEGYVLAYVGPLL